MVYCGIYPLDGSQFEALKLALEDFDNKHGYF